MSTITEIVNKYGVEITDEVKSYLVLILENVTGAPSQEVHVMDGTAGVTAGFEVGQSSFTLPESTYVDSVTVNRNNDYEQETPNNIGGFGLYSVLNTTLSISPPLELGDYIAIKYKAGASTDSDTIIDGTAGVTTGFEAGQSVFPVPSGKFVQEVILNRNNFYEKATANNAWQLFIYTQNLTSLTISPPLELSDYLSIRYR